MAEWLVSCQNLVKIYKQADLEVVALQGLDLEVSQGELIALVGASGSGKTTLLNVLGAHDQPSAGQCIVDRYDLARLSDPERLAFHRFVVGHLWQQSGRNLLPELSIFDNIALPQKLAGATGAQWRTRTNELLDLFGLHTFGRRSPQQLSGGERQCASLAVALANRPRLLLADEPTGELDTTSAHELLALLRTVQRQSGLTAIIVTHDIAVATNADRTIAIRDGRTSTETIRRDTPLTGKTVKRLGSSVMDLPGSTHREAVVIDRSGRLQLPKEAFDRIPFDGRAEVRISSDHVELWPANVFAPPDSPARED